MVIGPFNISASTSTLSNVHKEIFDGKSHDDLDEETLSTINKFFDNSLNVSETSRQLYIHTEIILVYRLEASQKTTGLG